MQILSPAWALLLVGGYGAILSTLIVASARAFAHSKLGFLAAHREIPAIPAAFSIADAWIWAPALFLSAEVAYKWGWVGLFWFTVPNVACLFLFAPFADRMRSLYPEGFTCAGYMKERHSKRVQNLYLLTQGGLATCSFAVQLIAGGKVVTALSGIPYFWATAILALIPVAYTMYAGIRASIASDFVQLSIVLVVGAIIVSTAVVSAGGFEPVWAGLYGKTGTYSSLFEGDGLDVLLVFGISTTIGLLSGPFGDQSFWQRAFSIKRTDVKKAFFIAPLIFVLTITVVKEGYDDFQRYKRDAAGETLRV